MGAQDIDAAYLFQDIGDIDDDLSSLLVPDLDFTGLNDMYTPSVKKLPPVQTGVNMDSLPSTVNVLDCTSGVAASPLGMVAAHLLCECLRGISSSV